MIYAIFALLAILAIIIGMDEYEAYDILAFEEAADKTITPTYLDLVIERVAELPLDIEEVVVDTRWLALA